MQIPQHKENDHGQRTAEKEQGSKEAQKETDTGNLILALCGTSDASDISGEPLLLALYAGLAVGSPDVSCTDCCQVQESKRQRAAWRSMTDTSNYPLGACKANRAKTES